MQGITVTVSDLSQYPITTVVIVRLTYSVLEVEVVRVGELVRDVGVDGCGVVEVPADVDGEDEREEVGVAVPDGRVEGGVAVLVLHRHLRRWMCGRDSRLQFKTKLFHCSIALGFSVSFTG